jgi:uncharacterized protein
VTAWLHVLVPGVFAVWAMIDPGSRLARVVDGLRRREAYPHGTAEVTVLQTHLSVVFLAGEFVYKLKKPVHFGFVDMSTLAKRRHFCEEEVRLNRRLSPHLYLGVVVITESPSSETRGAPD